ncbi:hypothetical protein ACLSZN_01805 [Avibacterium avium]|uniref:hypothetical protein n=1 Tax=Avibacterium avium TaxID=751 RepID=UPI003BF82998
MAGAETAKRAVENNFFHYTPEQLNDMAKMAEAKELVDEAEKEAKTNIGEEAIEAGKDAIDRGVPHYILVEGGFYKYSAKLAVNTRNGDFIPTLNISPILLPSKGNLGVSIETGWVLNLDKEEVDHLGETITNTLKGYSMGRKACFKGCIGLNRTIPSDYSSPKYILGIGAGYGAAGGFDYGLDELKLPIGERNEKN